MTDRLIDDPEGISVLAAQVADETGVPAAHIEKDFWVTEILRGVVAAAADAGIVVVFKGGTSLSKAYSIIERFSEDVDMLVVLPDDATSGKRDGILKALVGGAASTIGLEAAVVAGATAKGRKRGARFHYSSGHAAGSGLSEGVLLELSSIGGAMPSEELPVTSLIARVVGERIAGAVESEPVSVRVLDPSRTLVEKLVLLHTAHVNDQAAAAVRGARHFYDVHQLLSRSDVVDRLVATDVSVLARDVCIYSIAADLPAIPRPAEGFAASPAFTGGPHVAAATTEFQRRVIGQLLWPHAVRPSFEDCIDAVHRNRQLL